jgi:predicted Na+-dependent transporter
MIVTAEETGVGFLTKKNFLPLGLLAATGAALASAEPGAGLKDLNLVPWLVATIFVVNGYTLQLQELKFDWVLGRAFGAAALLSLGLGPIVGLCLAKGLHLAPETSLGLIVMSSMPTTLSSAIVIAQLAGGNVVWALFFTVGLNLVGIFSIPAMLSLTLRMPDGVSMSASTLLAKLLLLVLLPLIVGLLLRRLKPEVVVGKWLGFVPSTCVILTVWLSLSSSRDSVLGLTIYRLAVLALAALGVHFILLVLAAGLAKLLKLASAEAKALVFTSSQKTMPVALSVLAVLGVGGTALIVCLVFHFVQLMLDSTIAGEIAEKPAGSVVSGEV